MSRRTLDTDDDDDDDDNDLNDHYYHDHDHDVDDTMCADSKSLAELREQDEGERCD